VSCKDFSKKFEKPLDTKHKMCYNINVKRTGKRSKALLGEGCKSGELCNGEKLPIRDKRQPQ
jgi:hypothetical protein